MPRKIKLRKPKRALNAYNIFLQEMKEREETRNISFLQFTQLCAERWRSMNDEEKQYYRDQAHMDKIRYENEKKCFWPLKQGKKKPKRPMSAFLLFCQRERPKVKCTNPSWRVTQVVREMAKRWRCAPPAVRAKYKAMAKKAMDEYQKKRHHQQDNLQDSSSSIIYCNCD